MSDNSKIALITGATSGIGIEIAKHLVETGHSLILLARSSEKLQALVGDLRTFNSSVRLDPILCDLSSFKSIQNASEHILKSYHSIDLIILNAGLWNFEFIETKDGLEETFQVNLLAPFILFNNLKDIIPKNGSSKVVFTTSGLHQGEINFADIEFRRNFSGFKSYRQSKLGLILLTRWLANQDEYRGVSFFCVHPGMVNTRLGRNANWFSRVVFKLLGKSITEGAKTHIHLIDRKANELTSGEYYAEAKVKKPTPYSYSTSAAEQLWNLLADYNTELIKNV